MQLTQEQTQRQVQSQRISPQQIQANMLLQCSTQELLQAVALEQQSNPALESMDLLEDLGCPLCPPFGLCQACALKREGEADDRTEAMDADMAGDDAFGSDGAEDRQTLFAEWEHIRTETAVGSETRDGNFDPVLLMRAPVDLSSHLLQHLQATASDPKEAAISEYLVSSLDDQGYLHLDIDEACAVLRVPCPLIMKGIHRLQACDPAGIGARNLRECLLLQIQALQEMGSTGEYDPLAETLLRDHWTALAQRKQGLLARSLGVSPARLASAVAYIQNRLTPYPAAQFRQSWENCPNNQSLAVRPDVFIRRTQAGFVVEVLGLDQVDLRINPHYQSLYEQHRAAEAKSSASRHRISEYERHIVTYVERADLFLKNLQQRRRTIHKITQGIVEVQQGFLETGRRVFLRPMTRTRLAQDLGLHESTVSRALLHKFVQLPSQEVVPFDIFFENAVSAKDAMVALIAQEAPESPLTDQAITQQLTELGHSVARRTVVKYREELRIPASYLRRLR